MSGSYAYVAAGNSYSLQVLDVSHPSSPTLAGSVGLAALPRSIAASGSYAYVDSGSYYGYSLQVFAPSPRFGSATFDGSATFGGSVGIGTTMPTYTLDVVGNLLINHMRVAAKDNNITPYGAFFSLDARSITGGKEYLIFSTGNQAGEGQGNLAFKNQTDNIIGMTMTSTGSVGIGTTTPAQALHVVGNICATGTIGACSDARFKEHVESVAGALDKVEHLRGVTFDWKRDEFCDHQFAEGTQVGFIAQEVEKVLPQVVSTGSDGYKSVDYGRLTPVLVEAVKEMKAENDQLKDRLAMLESLINKASN